MAKEPVCYLANAHRVSRGASWSQHGIGRYSPQLSSLLTSSQAVSDIDYNHQRQELAIGNGPTVDILSDAGVIRTVSPNLGGLAETVTVVSYRGPWLYCASANDSQVIHIPTGASSTIGTVGVVDAVVASRSDDNGPGWVGPTYTPPTDFVVEADAAGWEVWSLDTGSPVSDLTQALVGISSVEYREGQLNVGSTAGVTVYDWALDDTTLYDTTTFPAIVNNTVNQVSSTIAGDIEVTNLFTETEDLTESPWINNQNNTEVLSDSEGQYLSNRVTGSAIYYLKQDLALVQNEHYSLTVEAKKRNGSGIVWLLNESNADTFTWFNLNDGTISPGGLEAGFRMMFVGDGWWRISVSTFKDTASGNEEIGFGLDDAMGGSISFNPSTVGQEQVYLRQPMKENSPYPHDYVISGATQGSGTVDFSRKVGTQDIGGGLFKSIALGLIFPTWQANTATDTSIFDNSGQIYDITGTTGTDAGVFTQAGNVSFIDTTANTVNSGPVPTADIAIGTWAYSQFSSATVPNLLTGTNNSLAPISSPDGLAVGSAGGLSLLDQDLTRSPATETPVSHLEINFNTGYGKEWDGAWANDNSSTAIPSAGTLKDNSGLANDLTVAGGTAQRPAFGASGVFGIELTDVVTASGTVTTGGQLIGWERVTGNDWEFRRDASEFVNASETAGTLTIGGDATGTDLAMLRWNAVALTKQELIDIEAAEAGLILVEPTGETC